MAYKTVILGNKRYTLSMDERDVYDFERLQHLEGDRAAYQWWRRRYPKPKSVPPKKTKPQEPSLFERRLKMRLCEAEYLFRVRSPYPDHPAWKRLQGNWDFHFEDYPRLGIDTDPNAYRRYVAAFRRSRLVGEWDGLWARFGPGLAEPIDRPYEGDVILPPNWVYAITTGGRELKPVPFAREDE